MAVIETGGAVRQQPRLLEGPQGGEAGNVKATFRELESLFGPDDHVEDAPPAWVIRVDSPDSRPAERVSLYARSTAPRQDPDAPSWWGLGASHTGRWAANRVAQTIAQRRQPGKARCETCSQLLQTTLPQGASEPVYHHAGADADHPPRPVTTYAEASGPEGFYVTMRRGKQTAFLLGPHDSYAAAEEQVPLGQRLARQVNPRSVFDAFGVTRVVMEPGEQLPPGKLNDLPEQQPAIDAYHHQHPAAGRPRAASAGPDTQHPEAGI